MSSDAVPAPPPRPRRLARRCVRVLAGAVVTAASMLLAAVGLIAVLAGAVLALMFRMGLLL